jgi:hypothetical protein
MKYMIFTIILTIICFFWLADTTITFSPFTFECKRIWHAVGMFAVVIGIAIMNGSAYNKGYKKGTERGVELYHDALMEKLQLAPDNSDKEPTDLEGSENN